MDRKIVEKLNGWGILMSIPSFLNSKSDLALPIEKELNHNYRDRLENQDDLSEDEIEHVSELRTSLFPKEFELDKETSTQMRSLCTLSQSAKLIENYRINSHRKFLGPFIVKAKRFLWKLVRPQLEPTFDGLQEFSSSIVYSHAKQKVELTELKKKLKDASSAGQQ